jgi:hypothetical protein
MEIIAAVMGFGYIPDGNAQAPWRLQRLEIFHGKLGAEVFELRLNVYALTDSR